MSLSNSLDFSSDTSAPAHPAVLEALAKANSGMAPSYGSDSETSALKSLLQDIFETELEVLPVASGTASNALALSLLCGPTESIICHREAHIERDERGAPEFFTGGGKLHLLDGEHARISVSALKTACAAIDRTFVHETPASTLSLTNLTECGTAYSPTSVAELAEIARASGLAVHMDGARFANALVTTGARPANMTWRSGVDVLTLGLTKTGAMGCELIILFGEARTKYPELLARAKRSGHLPPKMRFISAQANALLSEGLWLELASNANLVASSLAKTLQDFADVSLAHPVEGNEVFAHLPENTLRLLQASGLKAYPWLDGSVRFVCNWSQTPLDVAVVERTLTTTA